MRLLKSEPVERESQHEARRVGCHGQEATGRLAAVGKAGVRSWLPRSREMNMKAAE